MYIPYIKELKENTFSKQHGHTNLHKLNILLATTPNLGYMRYYRGYLTERGGGNHQ